MNIENSQLKELICEMKKSMDKKTSLQSLKKYSHQKNVNG